MKKIIIVLVAIIAIVFIASRFITIGHNEENTSPKVSVESNGELKNSPFQKEYLNKQGITVVNIWATWCKPCMEEMPLFKRLEEENPDVKFAFLSMDEDKTKLESYLSKNKINDITFQNEKYIDSIKDFLGGNGIMGYSAIPITFFIKDGKVVDKMGGGIDYNEVKTKLQSLK